MSTGARVGGVRPPGIPRESWLRRKTIKSEAARRVREVTDNRTNETTEAQVEAALVTFQASMRLTEEDRESSDPIEAMKLRAMRAALVAAQGAAPQAESAPTSKYISPNLPGMIRNLWKSDPSENSVRTALKLAGDLIQELIDLKASPVLPSSTVDEDALVQRVYDELMTDDAVAEVWSNGKVMATARRIVKFAVQGG